MKNIIAAGSKFSLDRLMRKNNELFLLIGKDGIIISHSKLTSINKSYNLINISFLSLFESGRSRDINEKLNTAFKSGKYQSFYCKEGKGYFRLGIIPLDDTLAGAFVLGTGSQNEIRNLLDIKSIHSALWQNSLDPKLVADATGIIIKVNKSFINFFKVSKNKIRGKHYTELKKYPLTEALINETDFKLKGKSSCNSELKYEVNKKRYLLKKLVSSASTRFSGKFFIFRFRIIDEDNPAGITGHFNSGILNSNDPRYFAHKIKSPVCGIKLHLENLKESLPMSKQIKKSFRLLEEEINRIQDITLSVLQGASDAELIDDEVNLNVVLEKIRDFFQPLLIKRHIRFINKVEPCIIKGSERDLHIMFLQIIENSIDAIQKSGFIELFSEMQDQKVKIYLRDSGNGIADSEKIFSGSYTTKQGSGLGLSIAKKVMEKHSGSLKLESSTPGETIFSLTFPCLQSCNV